MPTMQEWMNFAKATVRDQRFSIKRALQLNNPIQDRFTKDAAYEANNPNHFVPLIEVDRYNKRTPHFDKIISATHSHFWDPFDKDYIDYDEPFDMENDMMVEPDVFALELRIPAIADRLDEKQKVKFVNESLRWTLSNILHGEQGALSLSASLCHVLKDPGAQEYAANQAREEGRHVAGFARYIQARWGEPLPASDTLARVLDDVVTSPIVYKKIVGMQMLIEGLAMGAFAMIFADTRDPMLRNLIQLVMTDEAFHHKFGKIWADKTIPHLSEKERERVEDWAVDVFQDLLFNLVNPAQKKLVYQSVGLDWRWVQKTMLKELNQSELMMEEMRKDNNIFRVLIKTMLQANIITDRTRHIYAQWVDMDELRNESDEMVGDAIAEEGIKRLEGINFRKAA